MPSDTMSLSQVRAARAARLAAVAAVPLLGAGWLLRRTWRRLLPGWWAAGELAVAWVAGPLGVSPVTTAVAVAAGAVTAVAWPARSRPVRTWRAGIVAVLGGFAVATVAAGGPGTHPTLFVFGPALAAAVLGWPWWHHLRHTPQADAVPVAEVAAPATPGPDPLTEHWARRWHAEVVDQGVCAGTTLVKAVAPRTGVTEGTVRLAPGTKPAQILRSGPDVEVALQLDEGAVGWRSTGKAAMRVVVMVETSYIAGGVPWTGPTYHRGRCDLVTLADGSPGHWVFSRPGMGVFGGLIVGSTGAGKTRALGVLIANLLHAGHMVVVGDSQNGQSLPAWQRKTEYHKGPTAVTLLARRLEAEVMRRSTLLADAGVDTYDEADPRVRALGIKPLFAVIDECQLVLIPQSAIVPLVERAAETARKTGVALILATQLPQWKSLGGSMRIRDALVAGNAFVMRLSNRNSGSTILPDDFVGDPFSIEPEDEHGRTTAGMGYLRHSRRVGMLGRVPHLDEAAAAAACPDVPVRWLVDEIDPTTPIVAPKNATPAAITAGTGGTSGAGARLRAAFGIGTKPAPAQPASSTDWVLACLRRGPASAPALLDRPDCPVSSAQLYALLGRLAKDDRIVPPAQRGEAYTIAG